MVYRRKLRTGSDVIARAIQKYAWRRRMAKAARMRRKVYRGALTANPMPTFTETYSALYIQSNAGGVFAVRISDIPQVAQYNTLYKQYRINWVKVILVPVWNYESSDANAGLYNNAAGIPYLGSARITYAINDSPQLVAPANETDVLTDNGCKIKKLGTKLGISFKPVPDVAAVGGTTGNPIYTRQKFRQWFNFDLALAGNNPLHYGVSYFISQNIAAGAAGVFNVFYKVNFSLRDPQ